MIMQSAPQYRVEAEQGTCGKFLAAIYSPTWAKRPFYRLAATFLTEQEALKAGLDLVQSASGERTISHVLTPSTDQNLGLQVRDPYDCQ